jgi:hypothetical protein
MSHTHPFGIAFWITLFLEYSIKISKKIFKNHDNFCYNILISLSLKICQNMSLNFFFKAIKHVLLPLKNIGCNVLLMFFQIFSQVPMIYYECYHISKSYNFNMKLNYILNNMEYQTLVTLAMVRVTTIAPFRTTMHDGIKSLLT